MNNKELSEDIIFKENHFLNLKNKHDHGICKNVKMFVYLIFFNNSPSKT